MREAWRDGGVLGSSTWTRLGEAWCVERHHPRARQGCCREEEAQRRGALAGWFVRRIFLADLRGGADDEGREDVVDCHLATVVCSLVAANDREGGRFSGGVFFLDDGFPRVQVKTKREGRRWVVSGGLVGLREEREKIGSLLGSFIG